MSDSWTPERSDRLTALWSSTLGASEIASRLTQEFPAARPVSADAIQKKAKAVGLPPRPRTETMVHTPRRPNYQGGGFATLHAGMPREPTVFAEDVFPAESRKTLLELRWATETEAGDCRWPGADSFFCGLPAEPGKPWCSCHCRRGYRGRQLTGNEAEALAKTAA